MLARVSGLPLYPLYRDPQLAVIEFSDCNVNNANKVHFFFIAVEGQYRSDGGCGFVFNIILFLIKFHRTSSIFLCVQSIYLRRLGVKELSVAPASLYLCLGVEER